MTLRLLLHYMYSTSKEILAWVITKIRGRRRQSSERERPVSDDDVRHVVDAPPAKISVTT